MEIITFAALEYQLRTESLHGREHWVLPVVMLVEGVHTGSLGPLFYNNEVISNSTDQWNGIPVTVNHPEDGQGNFVSVNSPDKNNSIVGLIYNAHMEDGRLKAEAWVDIGVLKEHYPTAYEYIKQGRAVDVSTGAKQKHDIEEGTYNNEQYKAVVSNIYPDHLALLPEQVGACSWDDGCGVRNSEIMDAKEKLSNLFKNFQDGIVALMGSEQEIKSNQINMSNTSATPCTVNELIANEATHFTEDDRKWLEGQEEAQLQKLMPKQSEPKPVVNHDPKEVVQNYFGGANDPEQAIDLMPVALQASLRAGLRMHQEKRENLIKEITANSEYEVDELKDWTDVQLEKLNKTVLANKPTDYSLNGGTQITNEALTEEMAAMSYVYDAQKTKKDKE
jgi:hypothetical protein